MLTFRAKIFLSQLILFIIFFAMLMPFVKHTMAGIVQRSFAEETRKLIDLLKSAEDRQQIIDLMEKDKSFLFFQASLFNQESVEIFTTEPSELIDTHRHSEVDEALKKGFGYDERALSHRHAKFAFVAVAFEAHDQKYVLRTAFPYEQIEEIMQNFEGSFLIVGSILLLFFMVMTWCVFARLSQPIEQIIRTIRPYQEGKTDEIPHIILSERVGEKDDLRALASTLNSLSERVRAQVEKIREERNEKEAILESLGEGVIAVDAALKIQYVNFMASKMLGLPRRQLLGNPLSAITESSKHSLVEHCRDLLSTCQQQKIAVTDSISLGEGRKIYLDLIAAPKADERGAILVLQDNSNHYRVLEMGKDFVANASHELRTPITIIRGFAETLQDLPEISTEMLHDITEKILRSCQRMDHLVKSLLTLADIENVPLSNLQKCNLAQLIEQCQEDLLAIHPEIKVEMNTKGEHPIIASVVPELLELAITNLLENAVKYSNPPAHITIEIKKKEDDVVITIADRGMGIPEADLYHIFNRFYTVNKAHSRKLGGAGLGLSIVKTIVDKHDGTISVVSEVGQGTCFTIILPSHHS